MTEERDPKVSQRYRELRSEEPPHSLDRAIIAAAHRAAHRAHAPLVTPAGRHRWYFALGAAAILLLAVGITLHLERDRADPEGPPTSDRAVAHRAPARVEERSAPASAPVPQAPAVSEAEPRARAEDTRKRQAVQDAMRSERAETAEPPSASAARVQSPEDWLERIVQLRKDGKHEEAERQLADFRRRYPDYKIPEAALKPAK